MRKLMNYKALVAILVLALAMGACKKSSDDAEPIGSMSAKINETTGGDSTVISSTANWETISRVSVVKNNILTITGTSLSFPPDVIVITIYGINEGNYNLGLGTLSAQCGCILKTTYNGENAAFISTSGTVTLTKVDTTTKHISGTFEFVVYSGIIKTITEGKFENLKYTVQ